jgi:hypothetical protein
MTIHRNPPSKSATIPLLAVHLFPLVIQDFKPMNMVFHSHIGELQAHKRQEGKHKWNNKRMMRKKLKT